MRVIMNGNVDDHPFPQMRLYYDGFFSCTGQDSSSAWKIAYSGTYSIDESVYKEKMKYSTFPVFTNNEHWQDYTLKGDTLHLTFFNRQIDSTGKDIPKPNYTRELVLVRMKK